MLNVHFINRGYGTDEGYKNVELVKLDICAYTQTPLALIDNPYFPGDTLRARFEDGEWVCDLD